MTPQRSPSLFHELADAMARAGARMLCQHGAENEEAMYLTLMSILYAKAARAAGGEWVYVPRSNPMELEQARQRVTLALQSGEPPAEIARREGLSVRHVRRLRGHVRP